MQHLPDWMWLPVYANGQFLSSTQIQIITLTINLYCHVFLSVCVKVELGSVKWNEKASTWIGCKIGCVNFHTNMVATDPECKRDSFLTNTQWQSGGTRHECIFSLHTMCLCRKELFTLSISFDRVLLCLCTLTHLLQDT